MFSLAVLAPEYFPPLITDVNFDPPGVVEICHTYPMEEDADALASKKALLPLQMVRSTGWPDIVGSLAFSSAVR